jgi:hypothetical protein
MSIIQRSHSTSSIAVTSQLPPISQCSMEGRVCTAHSALQMSQQPSQIYETHLQSATLPSDIRMRRSCVSELGTKCQSSVSSGVDDRDSDEDLHTACIKPVDIALNYTALPADNAGPRIKKKDHERGSTCSSTPSILHSLNLIDLATLLPPSGSTGLLSREISTGCSSGAKPTRLSLIGAVESPCARSGSPTKSISSSYSWRSANATVCGRPCDEPLERGMTATYENRTGIVDGVVHEDHRAQDMEQGQERIKRLSLARRIIRHLTSTDVDVQGNMLTHQALETYVMGDKVNEGVPVSVSDREWRSEAIT